MTKELHTDGNISQNEIEIMECVIIEKAEQIPEIKEALLSTQNDTIALAISDKEWGTGLKLIYQNAPKKTTSQVKTYSETFSRK